MNQLGVYKTQLEATFAAMPVAAFSIFVERMKENAVSFKSIYVFILFIYITFVSLAL
jgi:hypothetical protein